MSVWRAAEGGGIIKLSAAFVCTFYVGSQPHGTEIYVWCGGVVGLCGVGEGGGGGAVPGRGREAGCGAGRCWRCVGALEVSWCCVM